MSSQINPLQTYWTVTRGTYEAIIRPLKGIDLFLFPQIPPVFDERDMAESFCQRFNNAQRAIGKPIALNSSLAIALAAA